MGWREWGILVRSHGELRLVLDVCTRHNTLAADPDRYQEAGTGEFLKAGVLLRFRGAIYVILGSSGGGTKITAFLHRRLPLAIFDPFEKPHGWIRVLDYLWKAERGPSDLREAAAPGTELHSALTSTFANPTPTDWCRELFAVDDDGDEAFGVPTSETFDDILGISERYLKGTGRSFIYRDPAEALPAIAASLSDLKKLNDLGFAFVSITSGVRTSTERRHASLRLLCPDADALTVARALFRHSSLAVHALLSDGAVINNLPCRRHADDDLYATFCPLWEQASGVKRNAEGAEVAVTRWSTLSRVWHCRADPIGTFLDSRFGFQDPHAALIGVAMLTVVAREWGPPATPVAAEMLELAEAMRPSNQE